MGHLHPLLDCLSSQGSPCKQPTPIHKGDQSPQNPCLTPFIPGLFSIPVQHLGRCSLQRGQTESPDGTGPAGFGNYLAWPLLNSISRISSCRSGDGGGGVVELAVQPSKEKLLLAAQKMGRQRDPLAIYGLFMCIVCSAMSLRNSKKIVSNAYKSTHIKSGINTVISLSFFLLLLQFFFF